MSVSVASCALAGDVLEVPTEGATSMLLVTLPASGAPELFAVALDREPSSFVSVPLAKDRAASLYALRYRCSLAALELDEGALMPSTSAAAGRALPAPDSVISTALGGGAPWMTSGPAALAAVKLAADPGRQTPCREFPEDHKKEWIIPDSHVSPVDVVVPISGDEALIATRDGRFFRASPEALIPLTALSTSTPHAAGARAPDGEVWLVGQGGKVVHGDPTNGFSAGPDLPLDVPCGWADASPSAPFEMFVLGCFGGVQYFDGTSWSVLDSRTGQDIRHGGITWVGPREAVAAGPDAPDMSRFKDGAASREPMRLQPNDQPQVAARTPLGLIAGTSIGDIFRYSSSVWTPLASTTARTPTYVIFPLGDGLAYGGTGAVFRQFFEPFGGCDEQRLAADSTKLGVALATRVLLIAHAGSNDVATFLEPVLRTSPAACP